MKLHGVARSYTACTKLHSMHEVTRHCKKLHSIARSHTALQVQIVNAEIEGSRIDGVKIEMMIGGPKKGK